jgi:hypothetical protein
MGFGDDGVPDCSATTDTDTDTDTESVSDADDSATTDTDTDTDSVSDADDSAATDDSANPDTGSATSDSAASHTGPVYAVDSCALCLSSLARGGSPNSITLPCGHRFHAASECRGLLPWIRSHSECPYCRKNFLEGYSAARPDYTGSRLLGAARAGPPTLD